jgi:Zn-dependent protease
MSGFDGARRINTNYGMPVFSKIEIRDIAISVAVLTAAFTIIFCDWKLFSGDFTTNLLCWIATAFLLVILSFILHEMGHKFTAQKFGAWSEYRMYPLGLALCLIMSVVGFLFAAPGAVYIRGYITDEMNGKISAAGPAVNIVIGTISFIMYLVVPNGLSVAIFFLLAYINSFLAVFNLLPIPPLDGSKIYKWNLPLYIVMLAIAGALLLLTYLL